MSLRRFLLLVVALGLAMLGWCYRTAIADPVVREADVALPDWPAGAPPVRALLMSDLHVAGPDMPPERLARIVEQANALRPDIVFVAGDFISDRRVSTRTYSFAEAVAPLAALRSRLGTVAVLGNHDHWRDAAEARASLRRIGVRVLDNDAAEIGPLAIGGLDDAFTHHQDLGAMLNALRALPGARVVLSHSPDPFPDLPRDVTFMLAGHTHCGQIRLPLIGAISTMSAWGSLCLRPDPREWPHVDRERGARHQHPAAAAGRRARHVVDPLRARAPLRQARRGFALRRPARGGDNRRSRSRRRRHDRRPCLKRKPGLSCERRSQ